MNYTDQIRWWLHATWLAPLMAILLGTITNVWMEVPVRVIMAVCWASFSMVCVMWWFWIMGAVRHIIETYDRVEHQLIRVSDQLTDIKRELGSIRENNY